MPSDLIFGHTWEEIQAMQRGEQRRAIDTGQSSLSFATRMDIELLRDKGLDWLENQSFFGVIDRLQNSGIIPRQNPARRNPTMDNDAVAELEIWVGNDRDVYPQILSIVENVKRKLKRGTYDNAKAVKLWRYAVDNAAKNYAREFASPGDWNRIFTVPTRNEVARLVRDTYLEMIQDGQFDAPERNPADRRNAKARKGFMAVARLRHAAQFYFITRDNTISMGIAEAAVFPTEVDAERALRIFQTTPGFKHLPKFIAPAKFNSYAALKRNFGIDVLDLRDNPARRKKAASKKNPAKRAWTAVHVVNAAGRIVYNYLKDDGSNVLQFDSGNGFVERDKMRAKGYKIRRGWPDTGKGAYAKNPVKKRGAAKFIIFAVTPDAQVVYYAGQRFTSQRATAVQYSTVNAAEKRATEITQTFGQALKNMKAIGVVRASVKPETILHNVTGIPHPKA